MKKFYPEVKSARLLSESWDPQGFLLVLRIWTFQTFRRSKRFFCLATELSYRSSIWKLGLGNGEIPHPTDSREIDLALGHLAIKPLDGPPIISNKRNLLFLLHHGRDGRKAEIAIKTINLNSARDGVRDANRGVRGTEFFYDVERSTAYGKKTQSERRIIMFQKNIHISPLEYREHQHEEEVDLRSQAVHFFDRMQIKGAAVRSLRSLTHKQVDLLDLQTTNNRVPAGNQHYEGIKTVSIDDIVGSEGRVHDFDISFTPLHRYSRSRWLNLAAARLAGKALPPVELIRVGDTYYVRDGHHRISVAKAFGEKDIDAEVTQWEVGSGRSTAISPISP
jgi:hypothetical protein